MYGRWLSHHGILGMKWGVRRYQNKDGSLTPQGKKRYNSDNPADFTTHDGRLKSKRQVRKLTNEDIDARITRLKKERELKQLINEQESPVKAAISKSVGKIGTRVLEEAGVSTAKYAAGATIKRVLGNEELADIVIGRDVYKQRRENTKKAAEAAEKKREAAEDKAMKKREIEARRMEAEAKMAEAEARKAEAEERRRRASE